MSDIYLCPNCEARMEPGEMCPECDHTDGDDFCECSTCTIDRLEQQEFDEIDEEDDSGPRQDCERSNLEDWG